jgi:hypothetical protein
VVGCWLLLVTSLNSLACCLLLLLLLLLLQIQPPRIIDAGGMCNPCTAGELVLTMSLLWHRFLLMLLLLLHGSGIA